MEKINTHTKGYKQTKLGWIPEDWDVDQIGKYYSFKNGLNKGKEFFGHGTPIINYKDVFGFSMLNANDVKGLVSVNKSEKERYSTKRGDLFFTRTSETINEIGYTSVLVEDIENGVFSGFVLRARPYDEHLIHPEFAAYCFQTFGVRKDIIRKSTYTTRALTNGSFLSEVYFSIPPLKEQQTIAKCLSTWDTAITKLAQLIKAKELQKKALSQQLLTGKKRLSGFNKDWEEQKLVNFFSERKEVNQIGLELLSIGESGVYPQSQSNKKDTSNKDKSKYKRICPNDIGYNTMRMWQGRSALSTLEGIVSPAYTIVKPKENTDSVFFSYLFKTAPVIHKFYRNSQGLVSDTLNCKFKDFAIVKIVLPKTKEEQIAISKVLITADKEIQQLQNQLNQLKEQKKGMMQQLLTGKKRLLTQK